MTQTNETSEIKKLKEILGLCPGSLTVTLCIIVCELFIARNTNNKIRSLHALHCGHERCFPKF